MVAHPLLKCLNALLLISSSSLKQPNVTLHNNHSSSIVNSCVYVWMPDALLLHHFSVHVLQGVVETYGYRWGQSCSVSSDTVISSSISSDTVISSFNFYFCLTWVKTKSWLALVDFMFPFLLRQNVNFTVNLLCRKPGCVMMFASKVHELSFMSYLNNWNQDI